MAKISSMGPGSEIPECEWQTLRALSRLSAETGMSLHVHTAVPMTPEQVLSVARCALDMGCTIGFDSWDSLVYILPDNYDRLKALVELICRGYSDQIVLGHDVSDKSHSASFGYTGYTGFAVNALPKLREMQDIISEEVIGKLVCGNPARLLAFDV